MKRFHGLMWPDMANADVMRYVHHAEDMRTALRFLDKGDRLCAVQAGGHCGVWPLWLSGRFSRVYTFEPAVDNWECLRVNCAPQIKAGRILATHACLGDAPTKITLHRSGKNTGGHKASPEPGSTPVVTIDGLQLAECNLIVLDVEGMELPALRGGENTLKEFKPVLMLEDRGHGERYGWGTRKELFDWLQARGYREVARVARDVVLKCVR